ncbi:MAG TPA: response regulator transcription factor [Thermoleophilaceae bacterium]|jgi:DNA-binding response OmpR family regulator|nr:response regulator transcription factor [Thermoleophilaceae bacterium]
MTHHRAEAVLVVEDEPTIAEVVARYLDRGGYRTAIARDGPAAVRLARELRPALVVLDLMLPGFDGFEVMKRIRQGERDATAVILLTARGEESDRIIGLRAGADDYVVKPFSPTELVARVDAVLRRSRRAEPAIAAIRFDGLEIDPVGRRVRAREQEVELTQREFDLLLFLAQHPGQVFTRDQLMDRVWEFAFYTDTTTVTVHVRRLRAKIEATPERPCWIQTVWGVGYRFSP